jgi:hypothetical protein
LVLTLEHLGARDYEAVPRGNGLPGLTLVPTNTTELSTTFVSESDFLVGTLEQLIQAPRRAALPADEGDRAGG